MEIDVTRGNAKARIDEGLLEMKSNEELDFGSDFDLRTVLVVFSRQWDVAES